MPALNLIGIIPGWEQHNTDDHEESERGINLQFRMVQCNRKLSADAVDFAKQGNSVSHRARACQLIVATPKTGAIDLKNERKCGPEPGTVLGRQQAMAVEAE